MEKYPKQFILAAIVYLLAGVVLGLGFTTGILDALNWRFVHIHIGLLGFMAMFIYGVAYHVLPRFNANPVKRPSLVTVHFYFVNVGLVGMVVFGYLDGMYAGGSAHIGFLISAALEVAGIFLFAYNIIPVLLPITQPTVATAPSASATTAATPPTEIKKRITEDMKVSEVLDKWPSLLDLFAASGFKALTIPAARATFAKVVTISQACKLHKVDSRTFLIKLNDALTNGARAESPPAETPAPEPPQKKAETAAATGEKISRGEQATAETLIGSLIDTYPETKVVFESHYGSGCFSCPGQAFETVKQTAMMHGIETEKILTDINDKIREALDGANVN